MYDLIWNCNQFVIVPRLESENGKNSKPDLNAIQHTGTTTTSGLCAYQGLPIKESEKIVGRIEEIRKIWYEKRS